jgi:hypothetical protein
MRASIPKIKNGAPVDDTRMENRSAPDRSCRRPVDKEAVFNCIKHELRRAGLLGLAPASTVERRPPAVSSNLAIFLRYADSRASKPASGP